MLRRGRTVLVTGASSGIGAALARALAGRGDTVALVARRADRLDEVLADCRATSPSSERWAADLSDPDAAADLALEIWDHYGGLDVVVNNAAVPMRRHVTRLTMAEVERTMRINYFSPVAISLAVLPRMLERGAGRSSTCRAWAAGWASPPRPPIRAPSSPWPAGASPWPSTSTGPAFR